MSERAIGTGKTEMKLPELLAPVGGRRQLMAAVNSGADAVYMGGSLFNARMRAENFKSGSSEGELKWGIDYAHTHGVRAYITLNTLIKERELPGAFEYACSLYEMGADAVILQDMGLARLIHKYLPDFPMHLSTQGTVYNRSGVE
ncbi:MAG: U32 family peptidase, partial [Clostridiales bacterium]|nr:U32 family peptidase [Clostridiales bacterium]